MLTANGRIAPRGGWRRRSVAKRARREAAAVTAYEWAEAKQEVTNMASAKQKTFWGVVVAALLAAGAAVVRALGG
jgi:hypothetical protein